MAGDASIRKALDLLASHQKEDGSIWDNPAFVNYATSAAVGAFSAAKIPAFRQVEVKGRDFLARSQIAGDEADPSYGGFPYKQDQGQPADLSNVQFALTALADAGLPKDHPVWTRALAYLNRMQNRSESNDYVAEVEIDGAKRTRSSPATTAAPSTTRETARRDTWRAPTAPTSRVSYGSMTYALLKCLLLAGADAKDPRVVAALGWITENFTVERNPGFEASVDAQKAGQQGYYYYVFTLARTLAQFEALTAEPLAVKDADGTVARLARRAGARDPRPAARRRLVGERGLERWEEGAPVLATSYALQALAELSGRYR